MKTLIMDRVVALLAEQPGRRIRAALLLIRYEDGEVA